ncbi:MAG TPA: hypothetical protein VEF03_04740 [Candidatus Binataceae bacterium]|nr:hypothetical protein [Candidatus Binataceae bacterium]
MKPNHWTIGIGASVILCAALAAPFQAWAQIEGNPNAIPSPYQSHYFDVATSTLASASGYGGGGSSGGVGDSLLRIANPGHIDTEQNGTICAMIYVFDDIEEMQACCGCPVTPDGLRTMSVINNVTKNFGVNRGNLNAGVIEIFYTQPNLFVSGPAAIPPQITAVGKSGWFCDPTSQFGPAIGGSEAPFGGLFVSGPRAWLTTTEGNAPVPAARGLVKGTSVSEFQDAVYGDQGSVHLDDVCFFVVENGSGTGACSCGSGDSFSSAALTSRAAAQTATPRRMAGVGDSIITHSLGAPAPAAK